MKKIILIKFQGALLTVTLILITTYNWNRNHYWVPKSSWPVQFLW